MTFRRANGCDLPQIASLHSATVKAYQRFSFLEGLLLGITLMQKLAKE